MAYPRKLVGYYYEFDNEEVYVCKDCASETMTEKTKSKAEKIYSKDNFEKSRDEFECSECGETVVYFN